MTNYIQLDQNHWVAEGQVEVVIFDGYRDEYGNWAAKVKTKASDEWLIVYVDCSREEFMASLIEGVETPCDPTPADDRKLCEDPEADEV